MKIQSLRDYAYHRRIVTVIGAINMNDPASLRYIIQWTQNGETCKAYAQAHELSDVTTLFAATPPFQIPSHDQAPAPTDTVTLPRALVMAWMGEEMQNIWALCTLSDIHWGQVVEEEVPLAVCHILAGSTPADDHELLPHWRWSGYKRYLSRQNALTLFQLAAALGHWVTVDEATDEYVPYTPHLPADLVAAARAAMAQR